MILYEDETNRIIGACMAVHNELGNGFLEAVYQDALEIEFRERAIPYRREAHIRIFYKGHLLDKEYYADFICFDKIIVELKAVSELTDAHKAQVRNYLTITNFELGILCNFNELYMEPVRILNSNMK